MGDSGGDGEATGARTGARGALAGDAVEGIVDGSAAASGWVSGGGLSALGAVVIGGVGDCVGDGKSVYVSGVAGDGCDVSGSPSASGGSGSEIDTEST